MYSTFSITFYCRKSKLSTKGTAPVEVSVCINGERMVASLPRRAIPAEFNKQMASKKRTPLKDYTNSIITKIEELQLNLLIQGKPFTKEELRNAIRYGFTENYATVTELFDSFLQSQKNKVDAGLSTLKNYRKYELVRDLFFKYHGIDDTVPVLRIKQKHIIDFNTYLLSKYDPTTVAGKMQKLKSIILYGLKNRMLNDNPFIGFKISRKLKQVEFLTQEEVAKIRNAKMPSFRMEAIRDLFLFQCFTSLSYIDMYNLTPSDYKKNEYGHIYINKERAKTGVRFCAILFDDAVKIAEKYNYKLPLLSNQRYNSYLKLLAELCEIKKPLHTHIGRHTAACYLLNKGLPLDIVARIMGHTTTKVTRHYAKLLDKSVFEAVEKSEIGKNDC